MTSLSERLEAMAHALECRFAIASDFERIPALLREAALACRPLDGMEEEAREIANTIAPMLQTKAQFALHDIADMILVFGRRAHAAGESAGLERNEALFAEIVRARAIIDGLKQWREKVLTCPAQSTPGMRDRIRELTDPARGAFDRAVMHVVQDYEALIRALAPGKDGPA